VFRRVSIFTSATFAVAIIAACTSSPGAPSGNGKTSALLTGLQIAPANWTGATNLLLYPGSVSELVASATFSDGTTRPVAPDTAWTSSAAAVAAVSPSGLVTAMSDGTADVQASYLGKSGSFHFFVNARSRVSGDGIVLLSTTPAPGTALQQGQAVTFTATVQYHFEHTTGGALRGIVLDQQHFRVYEGPLVPVSTADGIATVSGTAVIGPGTTMVELFIPLYNDPSVLSTTVDSVAAYPISTH
jgi:Big-like domain-containing protein